MQSIKNERGITLVLNDSIASDIGFRVVLYKE